MYLINQAHKAHKLAIWSGQSAEVVLTAKKAYLSLHPFIQGILRHYHFGIYIPISAKSYRMTSHFHYGLLLMAGMSLFSNNKHNVISVHSIKFLLVPMPAHKHHVFRPIVGAFIKTFLHADAALNPCFIVLGNHQPQVAAVWLNVLLHEEVSSGIWNIFDIRPIEKFLC